MLRLSAVTGTVHEVLRSTVNAPLLAIARLATPAVYRAQEIEFTPHPTLGTRVKLRYISQFVAKP